MTKSPFPFPMVERKVFANNPLVEVVCEIRFPTILRIESEVPATFQDSVRQRFPKFSKQSPPSLPELPPEVAEALSGSIPKPSLSFEDENECNSIALSSESISIVCHNYTSWDVFKSDIDLAVSSLVETYEPAYFERMGIRYLNVIEREKIGLDGESWASLLNPMVAGELAEDGWFNNIAGVQKSIQATLPGTDDLIHFQHGIGTVLDSELSYILDFDYFSPKKTEINDADGVIKRLHGYSGSAFQWAIADKLKMALG